MPEAALLEIRDLRKRFGGLAALDGVSLAVGAGTTLGLIGVNGSGKSTVMNCVNGLVRPDGGDIRLRGRPPPEGAPHAVARLGVGRTFQVPRVFRRMTLVENLLAPLLDSPERDAALAERAEAALASTELYRLRHNLAGELSGGQQKLLEFARLTMLDVEVALLDEPFAGVSPTLCGTMATLIERMVEHGAAVLLVSHDLASIYRLSHTIVVLDRGRVIAQGGADAIRRDPAVVEAYLGTAA